MLYNDDQKLEKSPVVANCCMNRERGLSGSNGYDAEIGGQPLKFLRDKVATNGMARWLDLCCGTGKALIQAATIIEHDGLFIANLDYGNLRLNPGGVVSKVFAKELRQAGVEHLPSKRLIRCDGRRELSLPFAYVGADDEAGPNYTKQPVVNSHYERR